MTTPPNTTTDTLKAGLPWFVFAILVLAAEYWLGWGNVLAAWLKLGWQQLGLALLLLLLGYAVHTVRLYDYFPAMQGKPLAALRLTLLHNAFSHWQGNRMAKSKLPLLMKQKFGISYPHGQSGLLWLHFLDLHTILCFALYPLLIVGPLKRLAIPILVLWMLLPPLVYWLRNRLELHFAGKDGKVSELVQKTLYGLPETLGGFLKSWGLTWLSWLVRLGTLAWLLGQFVDGVSWNVLVTAVIASELTRWLPLPTIAEAGSYEVGMVLALLAFIGLAAAAPAAINVHLFVLLAALVGGLVGWLLPSTQNSTMPTPPTPENR